MDPSFFGLSDNPFTKPAAPDSHCLADEHLALTTELHAGLKAPHGITLLIGDEGAGKTTFVRNFIAQLPDSFVVAYLPTAGPGLRHLLTEAVEQLGGTVVPGGGEQALIDVLRSLARARAEHDRATLVVIDDAHELPAKTIERLGKLFGTDPAEPSRLHVTLVGRPELLDRMNAANDRSILKHLVQVCRMDAIGPEDAFRYIADRIQKVGGIVDRLFTEDALRLIVQRANGNPARIDAICSAALERAAGRGARSVDTDAVDIACGDAQPLGSPEVGNVTNDPPEAPTYFFSEDTEGGAAAPTTAARDQRQATSAPAVAAPIPAMVAAGATSRRRLAFWAAGAIAVVAAFAGMMTLPERTSIQAENPPVEGNDAAAKADRRSENKGGAAEDAAAERSAAAVPKLVMRKDGDASGAAGHLRSGNRRGNEEKRATGNEAMPAAAAPLVAGPSADAKQPPAASDAASAAADRPRFPAPPLATPATGASAASPASPAGSASEAAKPLAQTPETAFPTSVPPAPAAPQQIAQGPAKAPTAAAPVVPQPPPPAPSPAAAPVPEPKTNPAVVPPPATAAPAAARAKPTDAGLVAPTRAPIQPSAVPAAPAEPAAPSAATASPAPAPAPSRIASAGTAGAYTIQIGAFSSRANAEALVAKVRGTVPDGKIVASTAAGKPVFRVVVGSFASPAEAGTRARALAKNGLSTFVRRID